MTLWNYYCWASAIVTFFSCLELGPPRDCDTDLDNFAGSFLMAAILGWIIWPFALWAAIIKSRRSTP